MLRSESSRLLSGSLRLGQRQRLGVLRLDKTIRSKQAKMSYWSRRAAAQAMSHGGVKLVRSSLAVFHLNLGLWQRQGVIEFWAPRTIGTFELQ